MLIKKSMRIKIKTKHCYEKLMDNNVPPNHSVDYVDHSVDTVPPNYHGENLRRLGIRNLFWESVCIGIS